MIPMSATFSRRVRSSPLKLATARSRVAESCAFSRTKKARQIRIGTIEHGSLDGPLRCNLTRKMSARARFANGVRHVVTLLTGRAKAPDHG